VLTWKSILKVTSDSENFFYDQRRELLNNGEVVREKSWKETIPRDHH
jgi:hypothetical protein